MTYKPGDVLPKDPDSETDFAVDWSNYLQTGESIASSTWEVPAGVTEETNSFTSSIATIWLSGGTLGEFYTLVNRITTDSVPARTEDASFTVAMVEK